MFEVEYLCNGWGKKDKVNVNLLVLCDWTNFRYPIDFAFSPRLSYNMHYRFQNKLEKNYVTGANCKRSKPEKLLPPHPRSAAESIFLVAWCFLMMLPVIYSLSYFKLYFDTSVEMYLLTFSKKKIVLRIFYFCKNLK